MPSCTSRVPAISRLPYAPESRRLAAWTWNCRPGSQRASRRPGPRERCRSRTALPRPCAQRLVGRFPRLPCAPRSRARLREARREHAAAGPHRIARRTWTLGTLCSSLLQCLHIGLHVALRRVPRPLRQQVRGRLNDHVFLLIAHDHTLRRTQQGGRIAAPSCRSGRTVRTGARPLEHDTASFHSSTRKDRRRRVVAPYP